MTKRTDDKYDVTVTINIIQRANEIKGASPHKLTISTSNYTPFDLSMDVIKASAGETNKLPDHWREIWNDIAEGGEPPAKEKISPKKREEFKETVIRFQDALTMKELMRPTLNYIYRLAQKPKTKQIDK